MSVDELRRGFDRLAAGVVPVDDPYGRLMRRARRRWRARLAKVGVAAIAVCASVVAAGVALQGSGGDAPTGFRGWEVTSEWTWRLIDSPTRGDLAQDAARIEAGLADAEPWTANANLPHTTVLFAGTVSGGTLTVVARYSDSHAVLDARYAPAGTPMGGVGNDVVAPVVTLRGAVFASAANWTLVLAPEGCDVATAVTAGDGTGQRTWTPAATQGWLVTDSATPPFLQVTCDGVVRQRGPATDLYQVEPVWPAGYAPLRTPTREGEPEQPLSGPDLTTAAGSVFEQVTAATLRPTGAQVAWTGRIPGAGYPGEAALMVGDGPVRPVLLYVAGFDPTALLAVEPPRVVSAEVDPRESQTGRDRWSVAATSTTGTLDLIGTRLPQRAGVHAWLTDRVLVTAPATAVRVEAVAGDGVVLARGDVADGVAVLTLGFPAAVELRAVDARDSVLASTSFVEPEAGVQLFHEEIINRW